MYVSSSNYGEWKEAYILSKSQAYQLSSEGLHLATDGKQIQRPIDKHFEKEWEGRILGVRGIKDTTRNPTESTNLYS